MGKSQNKALCRVTFIIIMLCTFITSMGVFYTTGGEVFEVSNQYGDTVKMYGDGIYSHDSYFRAPIFRGTDFTMLFIAIPLLAIVLMLDIKRNSLRSRLMLTSIISIFTYYSASIAFGVTYNSLHLLYIMLFSASFFGLIIAMMSLDLKKVEAAVEQTLPYKGIYIFLVLTGIALIVAWLPDIISALLAHRPLALIEVYTTEITYILDMGIIAPVSLLCMHLIKKRSGLGYVLLGMLLTVCVIIGVMLPVQTLFQLSAGIEIPFAALITKVATFCMLSLFALYFDIRLMKAVKDDKAI